MWTSHFLWAVSLLRANPRKHNHDSVIRDVWYGNL
jgi:hypothetical protein